MKAEEIFLAAVEQATPVDRAAYVAAACGVDADLRAEVERLLASHEQAGSFLSQPLFNPAATIHQADNHPTLAERPNTHIGPYKLLQPIGEGGMGAVWLAEQMHPVRRRVAVKIIKPGMDSSQVLARFEAERQALALMDHPNIAKVLDGGATETGRPYFVMELVKGQPITTYCDERRLSTRERLELFASVCLAIQHAHQKGIIHRDIKPSNVMVAPYDGRPVVKVIDFGVAKATGQRLTERTLFTEFGAVVGTLEYMSPEQAELNNQDIDTRSDVYSLGVLLYELLTGTTPLDRARLKQTAFMEMLRLIREEEPPKPSTRLSESKASLPSVSAQRQTEPAKLTKLVRGELDWIVMKALEKDRNRRYETANGFALDLQRYMADEAVLACPPSAGYRLRKFARRNKAAFATAALVSAVICVAVVVLAVSNVWVTWERNEKSRALVEKNAALAQESAALTRAREQEALARTNADEAQRQTLLARRRFYAAQMSLAQQAWQAGDPARTVELLESARPKSNDEDLRTFEWHHLWRCCQQGHRLTLRGHPGAVESVAFLPDGKTLASCGGWQAKLWDLATGKELMTLNRAACMAVSADGKKLAAGGTPTTIWDPLTQTKLCELDTMDVRNVAISPDGNLLATGGQSGELMLWDIATRKELVTLPPHKDAVLALAFSPDGKTLATATGWGDSVTKVWDLTADPPRLTRQFPRAKNGLIFLPDGKTLLTSGWGSARFCDLTTGQTVQEKLGSNFTSIAAASSPDGKTLAFGMEERTVQLWNQAAGHLRTYGHLADIRSVAFSPDGRAIAAGDGDGQIHVWDAFPQPEPSPPSAKGFTCAAFSPDGETLALGTSGGPIKLWDMLVGRELATLSGHKGIVGSVAFSPDGKTLASAAEPGDIKLWDRATGHEIASLNGHSKGIWAMAFSRDGKTLASGSFDGTAKLWDVTMRQPRATVGAPGIAAVAFKPDGATFATAGQYGHIMHWDTATAAKQAAWTHAGQFLFSVAFSPDGKLVASGGSSGTGTINLWEAATGRLQASLKGHSSAVYSLAFFPDGRTLASASVDGSARLWDVATGQERISLRIDITGDNYERPFVAISPDGITLVTGSQGANVNFYRTVADPEAKVEAAWQRAFERSGDDPLVWIERARWYDDRGETEKAQVEWQQVVEKHGHDPLVWIHRGRWYTECGEREKAATDTARAFELDPGHPLCLLESARQKRMPLATWDFSQGTDSWQAARHCNLTTAKGLLTLDSTGPDPQLVSEVRAPAGKKELTICARFAGAMDCQLFWATKPVQFPYSEKQSVRLKITGSESEFQEYRVSFEPDSEILSLRLDPPNKAGVRVELAWITLADG